MHRATPHPTFPRKNARRPTVSVAGPAAVLALILALAGCAGPKNKAPVEERSAAPRPAAAASAPPVVAVPVPEPPAKLLPGAENAGKPGYYTVQRGDTMIRIGLDNGQNWRDIARWNAIENPNLIEVGQVLRVVPPGVEPGAAVAKPVAPAARAEIKPLEPRAAANAAPAPSASTPVAPATPAKDAEDDLNWTWPAAGPVAAGFDDKGNKGLSIAGKAGDPVLAAADGRVVYAGAGLRGYGNLVIVKHNATYLSAYAHNQVLLVKEDQAVRRGQKIAEMGASDTDKVQLHFEIRRQGKPIDPAKLLPAR